MITRAAVLIREGVMQILKPDIRVYGLVEELASGPLPSWDPLPTVLILNKVCLPQALMALRVPYMAVICTGSNMMHRYSIL